MQIEEVMVLMRQNWVEEPKLKPWTIEVLEDLPTNEERTVTPEIVAGLITDLAIAREEIDILKAWGDYVDKDLDAAIFYAECVAEEMDIHTPNYAPECGRQHARIAEWLKELKALRAQKGVSSGEPEA